MEANVISPARLAVRLAIYFAFLFALVFAAGEGASNLPVGGHDWDLTEDADRLVESIEEATGQSGSTSLTAEERVQVLITLSSSLAGTVLLMLPITWVYMASQVTQGFRQAFVVALIVLPICGASIVLLIQDSLALAFGLAALVAAVRFRVRLRDALDGIYVFSAICVGLASGVGYLGIALVMTVFFCFAALILWALDYGANPIERKQHAKRIAKLEQPPGTPTPR